MSAIKLMLRRLGLTVLTGTAIIGACAVAGAVALGASGGGARPHAGRGVATSADGCPVGVVCVIQPATSVVFAPHTGGSGFTPLPGPPNAELDQTFSPPQGQLNPPQTIGPPAAAGLNLPGSGPGGSTGSPTAFAAKVVPKFFTNTDLGNPPRLGTPQEPTAAIGDNVVWYTGNTSVALSTDAGTHFTYFDPSTILPDNGLPFCCDQLVSYSPQANVFVWVMQYWCGKGTSSPATTSCRKPGTTQNRIRIAVATPEALKADAKHPGFAWTYWDLTPLGFGVRARTAWLDQSKMAVNKQYFNWSVDILRGSVKSVVARVPLAELAARGTITMDYYNATHDRIGVAQGLSTTTAYFATNNSASQVEIWSWPASKSATVHFINHSTVPKFNGSVDGTDGQDWNRRWGIFPAGVEGVAVSGSTLYVAQATGRDYCSMPGPTPGVCLKLTRRFSEPAVFISEYNVSSWKKIGERWIWNSKVAFTWPELQTDGAGDVGIVFRVSRANHNPQPAVMLLTPGKLHYYTAEPAGLPLEAGDYYGLRPGPTSDSFVMTGQTKEKGGNMHWDYIEWGRVSNPPSQRPTGCSFGPITVSGNPGVEAICSPNQPSGVSELVLQDYVKHKWGDNPLDSSIEPGAHPGPQYSNLAGGSWNPNNGPSSGYAPLMDDFPATSSHTVKMRVCAKNTLGLRCTIGVNVHLP
jgi:hypothetical protein